MSLVGLFESILLAEFLEQSNIDLHMKEKVEDNVAAAFGGGQLKVDRGVGVRPLNNFVPMDYIRHNPEAMKALNHINSVMSEEE